MKFLVVLAALVTLAASESCYKDVSDACRPGSGVQQPDCTSLYSAFGELSKPLDTYAVTHVQHSYDYLLMATYFGNYQANRDGFRKLFMKLSDNAWDKSINLIKYITKRGGIMSFSAEGRNEMRNEDLTYLKFELGAMAKALDLEKKRAETAHKIHGNATRWHAIHHDPEVAQYLEEEFMEEQAETIRTLAGHSSDLLKLTRDSNDASLSLFVFDEYLQKL